MAQEKILRGSLYMTIGFFFVALFGASLKAATDSITSVLWGTFVAYLFAGIIQCFFIYKEGFAFLKTKKIGGYAGRVIFGVISTLLYIGSIQYISLLNATVLFSTVPLFIPIFAIFMLKSKVPLIVWSSLIVGFIGILFLLRPDVTLFDKPGNLIGLASGIVQALAFIYVKILTETEPIRRINFYFFFLSSLLLAPFVFYYWEPYPLLSWIWALFAGVTAFLGQMFIVKGYQEADASRVGAFQYVSVIFSGLIGWIIWNQTPSFYDIIGVVCIMIGGILAITFFGNKKLPIKKI